MSDAIERAIDKVEAGEATPEVMGVGLPMLTEAMQLPPDGGIRFNQLEGHAGAPRVLILDVNLGAWRPVFLAPGTWSLQPEAEEQEPPKPKIWTP